MRLNSSNSRTIRVETQVLRKGFKFVKGGSVVKAKESTPKITKKNKKR